jgi:Ca2+-binding RTX toxin-like protein
MPTLIVDTNSITPTTLTSTGPGDSVFVSSNSTLLDVFLSAGGVDATFRIFGQLNNDYTVLDIYTVTPGDIPVLYVGSTGVLSSDYQVYQGNSLSLTNDGTIISTSPFGTTIAVYEDNAQSFFSLRNSGYIGVATPTSTGAPTSFGATVSSNIGGVVNNSGTIYAPDRAIYLGSYNGSHGDLTNTGIIDGDVLFGSGTDRFINHGTLFGHLDMGAGDDFYFGRDGVAQGFIQGGAGNDHITGGNNADLIDGGTEFDYIHGRGGDGDDLMDGGTSSDSMGGGEGNDLMYGGGGNDTMYGYTGEDSMFGNDGSDLMVGGDGDDTMNGGNGNDVMYGGRGDDSLGGGDNNDTMYGGDGNDYMLGWTGNDSMFGNDGRDDMNGQVGSDYLNGGWGNDTLTGGSEADTFAFVRFSNDDVITDFQDGIDRIDMTAFQLVNFAALSGSVTNYNGGALIDLDSLGGDGSVWVQNVGAASLTAADFIL